MGSWAPPLHAFEGSLFIIYDVCKKPTSQQTIHHHLLLLLSIVDCLSSIAWAFSTLPSPATDEYGDPTHVYGARGNDATCTAQGFFVQLGLTSPFYNLAMAIHHMLVISYEWNEIRIKKVRWWLYLIPPMIGLGLALGGMGFYGSHDAVCWITGWTETWMFLAVPLSTVTVLATLIMFMIYRKVYRQQRRSGRWSLSSNTHQSISRKVFWQAFWYLMCFYATWPIVVVLAFINTGLYEKYGLHCLVILLAPLQGFLNFINYSRPRFLRCIQKEQCFVWKAYRTPHTADLGPEERQKC